MEIHKKERSVITHGPELLARGFLMKGSVGL